MPIFVQRGGDNLKRVWKNLHIENLFDLNILIYET